MESLKPAVPGRADAATLELARQLLNRNEHRQVIEMLSPLLEQNPDHAEALFVRGTAWLELQGLTEARRDLVRAAELNPGDPRIFYNLSLTYWIEGNVARTIELCQAALAAGECHPAHVLMSNIELSGDDYFQLLHRLQHHLKPRTYLEVGVFKGSSLRLVAPEVIAIGVDPEPILQQPLGPNQRVFRETSDHFFETHDVRAELGGPVEFAFIDGMHLFEYALRDFINLERLCTPDSTIVVHDCYPLDRRTAERERVTMFWSGDIWRLILLLKKYRPDLEVHTIATPPTGLGLIRNLDPASRVLADNLERICAEFKALDYAVLEDAKQHKLNLFPNDWAAIQPMLDARARGAMERTP